MSLNMVLWIKQKQTCDRVPMVLYVGSREETSLSHLYWHD